VRRGGERAYVLRRGPAPVAQLVVPLPFRGEDPEHGETGLRWAPVVLAGYCALGLSGAVDPFEASVIAWLTPFGGREWELMRGASLPSLGLPGGAPMRFPEVPGSAPSWPRSAG
jgi:hypothetical protein